MINNSRRSFRFLEWCLAWEILIFSGGTGESGGGITFLRSYYGGLILLVTSICLSLLASKNKAKNKEKSSTVVMLIVVVWMSVNSIIFDIGATNGFGFLHNFLPILKVYAITMYLAISALSFRHFRNILLKALTYLSAATLIAWALRMTLGIGTLVQRGSINIGVFQHFNKRTASIYWEPGQYQIIIIFVLVLFLDELRQITFSNIKYYIKKFGIIILALVICQSTTGYLSLIALIGIIFMFNISAKKNKILYIPMILVAFVIGLLIFNSDVVQNKIDPNKLSVNSSYGIRLLDNIALIRISLISPLTGLGRKGDNYVKYSNIFFNKTASNGWFAGAASLGWPFLIMYICCIFRNLKRMKLGVPALFAFIPLFLSQSGEAEMLFPIMYLYVYRFRDYVKY